MTRTLLTTFFLLLLSVSGLAAAPRCQTCARDARGRIVRSASAKRQFRRQNPCPVTGGHKGACPGYVIDHVQALACGGPDEPENMQWQSKEEAREKDRWETRGCNW